MNDRRAYVPVDGGIDEPMPAVGGRVEAARMERGNSTDGSPTCLETGQHKLKKFLDIESQVRAAKSLDELHLIIANETSKIVDARQVFVFSGTNQQKLKAISDLPGVERSAPLAEEIERTVSFLGASGELASTRDFEIPHYGEDHRSALEQYPLRYLLWVPIHSPFNGVIGGMLLARDREWTDPEALALSQIADVYAYTADVLRPKARSHVISALAKRLGKRHLVAAVLALGLFLAWPVSMKTLAPFEIAARDPFIVSSHIDGVIESVLVDPGENVVEGQAVVRFTDTVYRNALEIAQNELAIAEAKLMQSNQLAFNSSDGRRELGLALADISLKQARLDLAREQLAHTTIHAARDGVAIFADKQKLIGKPVTIGEQVLLIASSDEAEVRIRLPVADSIFLEPDARALLFLDSDPLNAREAAIEHINYQATPSANGDLAYEVMARMKDTGDDLPRLGVQGTAQVYGRTVPMAFYLFRRPLTFARQRLGW
jgi:hypothetical protein